MEGYSRSHFLARHSSSIAISGKRNVKVGLLRSSPILVIQISWEIHFISMAFWCEDVYYSIRFMVGVCPWRLINKSFGMLVWLLLYSFLTPLSSVSFFSSFPGECSGSFIKSWYEQLLCLDWELVSALSNMQGIIWQSKTLRHI